jgi:hypothetical protein
MHIGLGVVMAGSQWRFSFSKNQSANSKDSNTNGACSCILNLLDANWAERVLLAQQESAHLLPLAAWSNILFWSILSISVLITHIT